MENDGKITATSATDIFFIGDEDNSSYTVESKTTNTATGLTTMVLVKETAEPTPTPEVAYGASAGGLTSSGTLAEAIAAEAAYIQLQKDITSDSTLTFNSSVTIDLNGKTLTANATDYGVYVVGDLAVADTSDAKNGSLCGASSGENGYGVYAIGSVTVSGGSLSGEGSNCGVLGNSITVTGGTLRGESGDYYAVYSHNSITVTGGSLSGAATGTSSVGAYAEGDITVSGGELSASCDYIGVYSEGTVTVSGEGKITATGWIAVDIGKETNSSYTVESETTDTTTGLKTKVLVKKADAPAPTTGTVVIAAEMENSPSVELRNQVLFQFKDADGYVVANRAFGEFTEGEHPVWKWTVEDLPIGAYTVCVAEVPAGYGIPHAVAFTLDADGTISTDGTRTEDGAILIELKLAPVTTQSVEISAVDADNDTALRGATLQILTVNEQGREQVVEEWVSAMVVHEITGLNTGVTYTLRAVVAPDGYIIPTDTTFSINADGTLDNSSSTTTVEYGVLLAEFAKTAVKISTAESVNGVEIAGAYMQILNSSGDVVVVDGFKVEWTSDGDVHTVTGLKTDEPYTIRTTVAPNGYTISTDTSFTIDADGDVTTTDSMTEDGVLLVEFDLTDVEIKAVDTANGEAIAGATMQILDEASDFVADWVSRVDDETTEDLDESITIFCGLETGVEYTLHAAVVPHGYTVPADTTFTLDYDGNISGGTTKTKDGVLLVEFEKNPTYTVTFVDWNNEELKSETVERGKAATAPTAPTREGYTFDGWDKAFDNITAPLTVQAKYTINRYAITFNNNGADIPVANDFHAPYGASLTSGAYTLPTPGKTHYQFAGWYLADANGQMTDTPAPDTMPANDLNLIAKWTPTPFRIFIAYLENGTVSAPETAVIGETVTLTVEPNTGYSLTSISAAGSTALELTKVNDTTYTFVMPGEPVVVEAAFEINKHDIIYMVDGAEYDRIEDVAYGTAITLIAEPTRTGYTFSGWSTIPDTMPDGEVVINGTFTVNSYLIDWMVRGHNEDGSTAGYRQTYVNYGDPITPPQMGWDKEGYLFSGWQNVPATMPAENIVIYGEWIKNFGTI